jgi:cytidylate kinase
MKRYRNGRFLRGIEVFITATSGVRAQRRVDDLKEKGEPVSYEEVLVI